MLIVHTEFYLNVIPNNTCPTCSGILGIVV